MRVSELQFIDQEKIYINPDHVIDYSDGEKNEQYIYDALKKSDDNSIFSEFLYNQIRDWSSEYHFSTYRSNIVRALEIEPHYKVLEIGSGCGAITRYLGETGAAITSVEGSYSRATCTRQRCKDLDNVKVICSNVEEIEFEEQFDIITLIGVFEYTAKYSQQDQPFITALHHYTSLLKPEGVLVIAIENKLGLKYFSGYNEDHFGIPYFGLEDRYVQKDVRTFGRVELKALLASCGFDTLEFLYPFPDYKLPKVVISEQGFDDDRFNTSDLIKSTVNRHYSPQPKANTLNENLVCDTLVTNGIMKDLSNSFLILAGKGKDVPILDKTLLAAYYTCERYEPYNTATSFKQGRNGISVIKDRIGSEIPQNERSEQHNFQMQLEEETPYIEGFNLHFKIIGALYKKRYKEYEQLMQQWIQFLRTEAVIEAGSTEKNRVKLKSEYFDALPFNVIINGNNTLVLFDQEWKIAEEFDITFLVVRYLSMYKRRWGMYRGYAGSYLKFVNKTLVSCGLNPINKSKLRSLEELDEKIRHQINRSSRKAPLQIAKSVVFLLKFKIKEIRNYFMYGIFAQN